MLLKQRQPIPLRLIRNAVIQLQQGSVRCQNTKVGVGSAGGLRPVTGTHEHDQPLLSGIDHAGEGFLKDGITFLNRQQRENIRVGRDPLTQPQIDTIRQ
ncbi:MAG TPA: hypothetical protein VLJ17_13935 [Xanthobacteraceae bacterium]|nr:hypothetical protein [Xanthobacteraceae bacterium]